MEVLPSFHARLKAALEGIASLRYRILFVDDGSDDGTLDVLDGIALEDPAVRVYSLSRNFGHQIALSAGLDVARGDAVVMMDCDLQHPPSLIPELVARWRQGADVVSAVRRRTSGEAWFKRLSSRGFYRLINWMSDTPVHDGAADFCLLSRRAHRALRRMPERHRFLRGMVSWIGFRRVFVDYDAPARAAGRSKYTLPRMLRLAATAVFSFSAAPLRTASRVGLVTIAAGFAYLTYVVGRYLLYRDLVPGWSSVVSSIVILGGLQLFFIGLIGEYLSRVFEEVKGRPLYLFKQKPGRRRRAEAPELEQLTPGLPLKVTFGAAVTGRARGEGAPAERQPVVGLVESALLGIAGSGDGDGNGVGDGRLPPGPRRVGGGAARAAVDEPVIVNTDLRVPALAEAGGDVTDRDNTRE